MLKQQLSPTRPPVPLSKGGRDASVYRLAAYITRTKRLGIIRSRDCPHGNTVKISAAFRTDGRRDASSRIFAPAATLWKIHEAFEGRITQKENTKGFGEIYREERDNAILVLNIWRIVTLGSVLMDVETVEV